MPSRTNEDIRAHLYQAGAYAEVAEDEDDMVGHVQPRDLDR